MQRSAPLGVLNGRNRVVARREAPVLGLRQRKTPDELGAQVVGLDLRVNHQLGCEVQDVDVGRVLVAHLLRGGLLALGEMMIS